MEDFRDRVAIVTGGAQSIGFTVAEALGGAGSIVILADIRRERMQQSRENCWLKAIGAKQLKWM